MKGKSKNGEICAPTPCVLKKEGSNIWIVY